MIIAFVMVIILASFIIALPISVEAQTKWESYTAEDLYSFSYPSNWNLEEKENRFTTIDARLEYGNNDVQMVFETGDQSLFAGRTDNEILASLQRVANDKGTVFESGTSKYNINNMSAPWVIGKSSTDSLFGRSVDMVQLAVVVHLDSDQAVLVRYAAEENDFDKYLPKAEQVIKSIKPINSLG